jgi:hypothetical protein
VQCVQGKPEGKRALARPRHIWEDNIEMDLKKVGCWCMDFIDVAQDREMRRELVKALINFLVL